MSSFLVPLHANFHLGMFSSPVALGLYALAFERAGALDKLEAFASFNGPDFYGVIQIYHSEVVLV